MIWENQHHCVDNVYLGCSQRECQIVFESKISAGAKEKLPTRASGKLDDIFIVMPCRLQLHQHRETCDTVGQHKTKYACVVEADESMRIRVGGSQNKNHEDHIAEKGMSSLSHCNLVHEIIPMPQAMKNQMQRQQWKNNGKTWRTF